MRLLDVESLKVESFAGSTPQYAILSHTWEDDEVTLQHLLDDRQSASRLKGFIKLKNACAVAKADGYKWLWMDTCCIDKTSSAELSEAINSMFLWYRRAGICYGYISDVSDVEFHKALTSRDPYFPPCRWLTRGWTLQELIAPQEMHFFSRNWKKVGSKRSFATTLSQATGIPPEALEAGDVSGVAVCEKMRWIAGRETTRPEDIAYCALGIFDINMPLLYGEGSDKAFRRLQEEILRASDDPTIYLWTADPDDTRDFWGLLADSPSQFKTTPMGTAGLNSILSVADSSTAITSKGLALSWQVAAIRDDPSHTLFVVFLARKNRIMYAILLQQMDYAGVTFARVAAHTKVHVVITGAGRQSILCPAGPHDAERFPRQRIHPGDTHLGRFTVKHDPVPPNVVSRKVAVGFVFDLSKNRNFKIESMGPEELPRFGFETFDMQNNLLFHRFVKNGLDPESEPSGFRTMMAAFRLRVAPDGLFVPADTWSEPFHLVLAISPVESSSIGTVAPFVRPHALFPPKEYWSKPLHEWIKSNAAGATFHTDMLATEAGDHKIRVSCSFRPKMLLAEPYYEIVLSLTQEKKTELPKTPSAPLFSFNTKPKSQSEPRDESAASQTSENVPSSLFGFADGAPKPTASPGGGLFGAVKAFPISTKGTP